MAGTQSLKTFRAAVAGGGFTLTGQLRLYQDTGRDDVVRQAECLAPAVHAVAVTDCPYGVLHMSGLAAASILLQRGPVVPERVVRRFEQAKDPEAFGVAFCAETIQAIKEIPGIGGVNLSTTGAAELIVAALARAVV